MKESRLLISATHLGCSSHQAMTEDLLTVLNEIPFSIPPYFALLARAVVTLEGEYARDVPRYGRYMAEIRARSSRSKVNIAEMCRYVPEMCPRCARDVPRHGRDTRQASLPAPTPTTGSSGSYTHLSAHETKATLV